MKTYKIKQSEDNRTLLNLACGSKYHLEWNNIEFPRKGEKNPNIIYFDLLKGIPFKDDSFDVVYHSNFLEHLNRHTALKLLKECNRVMKKGGIIRVVVPDLEREVKEYLKALRFARIMGNEQFYEFAVLNLLDQLTRTKQGGQLITFLKNKENYEFLCRKIGKINTEEYTAQSRLNKLPSTPISSFIRSIKRYVRNLLRIGKKEFDETELHKWMYDSYSLKKLLKNAGFKKPKVLKYNKSQIRSWKKFRLDINLDESPYKPDGLFMEARK